MEIFAVAVSISSLLYAFYLSDRLDAFKWEMRQKYVVHPKKRGRPWKNKVE